MARFEGRVVIVTGAASGIGFEMAAQFLAEGAIVHAGDVDPTGSPDGLTPASRCTDRAKGDPL